jgi:antirestriction protein ArdC
MPWRRSLGPLFMPANALTGNAYNGINVVSLWVSAEVNGFTAPVWATYRQWSELGAQVRKGEKSSLVIFYKEYETDADPDNADDDGKRRVARASYVFNANQVDGFALPAAPERLGPIERIDAADRFVGAIGVRVEHGGERAYYRPSTDHIQMPDEGLFCGTDTMTRSEAYFAVILHETIHASGAKHRLDRDMGKRFGDAAYAAEELVAEIGSAFLCSELGITQDVRADHASISPIASSCSRMTAAPSSPPPPRRPRLSRISSACSPPSDGPWLTRTVWPAKSCRQRICKMTAKVRLPSVS